MMQAIIYQSMGGGLCVETPAGNISSELATRLASGRLWSMVDLGQIPSDRTFRAAWAIESGEISINLAMAKEIQRNRWREARESLLKSLDVQFIRALEDLDTEKQSEITEKKQALRDVTLTDLSEVTTVEELKAVWPKILNP